MPFWRDSGLQSLEFRNGKVSLEPTAVLIGRAGKRLLIMSGKKSETETGEKSSGGRNRPPDDSTLDDFPDYLLQLSKEDLQKEIEKRPEIVHYLASKGLTADQLADYIDSVRGERAASVIAISSSSPSVTEQGEEEEEETEAAEMKRRSVDLQRLQDYVNAATNEAILARRALDDAEVAFKSGATMLPHTVLEVQRKGPGDKMNTPVVVSSGGARVVVSLDRAHRGLRAPAGYYNFVSENIMAKAREFTSVTPDLMKERDTAGQIGGGGPTAGGSGKGNPGGKGKNTGRSGTATPEGGGGTWPSTPTRNTGRSGQGNPRGERTDFRSPQASEASARGGSTPPGTRSKHRESKYSA